ncbi:MAG: hypothetical protein U1E51_06330 [Candidatus Binatia bacterium]|nr:hypothetical protein [Candidatus Binatia bacterium]
MSRADQARGDRSLETRRLFRAWLIFATINLGLAAFFVIPAALGSALGMREVLESTIIVRFLISHIFFSMVAACSAFQAIFWMLAVLWVEASRFPVLPAWIGFGLAVAGSGLSAISTLSGWGDPVLAEFVPVVVEPAFLSGFGLFALGVAVTTGSFIYAITSVDIGRMPLIPFGMLCTALIMVAAGLSGVATMARLFGDWFAFQLAWRTPYILTQAIFWGPGHLITFSLVGTMVVSWILLMPVPGLQGLEEQMARIGFVVFVFFAAVVLVVLFAVDPLALPKMTGLNVAIRGSLTLPVLFLGSLVLRHVFSRDSRPRSPALLLSILLFTLGLLIALVGIGHNSLAWVPPHYEAMIPGAVLVAFMGVTAELILPWDRSLISEPLARIQAYLYGGGIFTVALGMFWAALLGGERRGYFITIPAKGPAVMLIVGGITAGLGILAFMANTFGAFAERPTFTPTSVRRVPQ